MARTPGTRGRSRRWRSTVPGVLVDLDSEQVAAALPILDDVEDTATDKLRRIVVTTTDGVTAWAYYHHHPVADLPQLDFWPERFAER